MGRSVKLKFGDECVTLATRMTFRIAGIELGERLAMDAHFTPRITKALLAGRHVARLGVWPRTERRPY